MIAELLKIYSASLMIEFNSFCVFVKNKQEFNRGKRPPKVNNPSERNAPAFIPTAEHLSIF